MTFYEAALRVLESEGHPLHFLEITEKSIAQNLLSHVGKMPEQTMLSRLAAMAKRTRDRRVIVTAKDTFALPEWGLPEDAAALAETGLPEENEEENLPPLRPTERHPEPRADLVRSAGRGERHKKREREEERGSKRKRYPPIAEVAFEVLSDSAAEAGLAPPALLELARTRELVSSELSPQVLLMALIEDNQRRIDAGRRPQFRYSEESPILALEHEREEGVPGLLPQDLQLAFAKALGVPVENGRPVLRSRPSAAPSSVGTLPSATSEEAADLFSAARSAVREARRASAKTLRQKLADLEVGTLERACVKMLHGLSFRELKVAKRSKDGPLLTGRRKEGSVELRWVVRVWRASAPLDRRTIQDLRRDVSHFSANIGLLLSPQDVRSEARTEAQGPGALAFLWCGDALAEKFMEAHTGVKTVSLEMFEPDESFFVEAAKDAEEALRRREDRQRERDGRPPSADEGRDSTRDEARDEAPRERVRAEASPSVERDAERTPRADTDTGADDGEGDRDDDDGPDDGEEGSEGGASAAPGSEGAEGANREGGRRRRRRRRGRRGRGPRPEGAAAGAEGAAPGGPPPPSGGGDSGGGGGPESSA